MKSAFFFFQWSSKFSMEPCLRIAGGGTRSFVFTTRVQFGMCVLCVSGGVARSCRRLCQLIDDEWET